MFRRKEEEENDQLEFGNDNAADETVEEATAEVEEVKDMKDKETSDARPAPASAKPSEPAKETTAAPRPAPAANFRSAPQPVQAAPVTANRAPISANGVSEARTPSPASKSSSKRILTVGNDIHMKGEINTCDRLVIEGIVDATLKDVHTVELAETGSLRGTAEVEDAEISGYFEGDLTVTGRLIIYSSGTVRGNVTYGEIEIERGGQLSGSIAQVSDGASAAKKTKKAA